MKKLGIIGFGQFGQFMALQLAPYFEISVCDKNDLSGTANAIGVNWCDFESVAAKSIVVFATPLSDFEEVLKRTFPFLKPKALCLDVCSVKDQTDRTDARRFA